MAQQHAEFPAPDPTFVNAGPVQFELVRLGHGRPILFLHPSVGLKGAWPALSRLAVGREVLVPSHPGFGGTKLVEGLKTVDDISYCYLDVIERLDLRDLLVVGNSFGAWIAMQIAIKDCSRLSGLVLASPIGPRLSDRDQTDVVDVFSIAEARFLELAYANEKFRRRDYGAMTDDEITEIVQNRETLVHFAWSPYLNSPRLSHKLHRITVPVLIISGENDGLTRAGYVDSLQPLFPQARAVKLPNAGHFPHVEQPAAFADEVLRFAQSLADAAPSRRPA